MKDGFIKVAAATPEIRVGDPGYNEKAIFEKIKEAAERGAKVIVLPELSLSGYTCGDLFLQQSLIRSCNEALARLIHETGSMDALIFVGFPYAYAGKLYNVAAAVQRGSLLGFVSKTNIPDYSEFYEARHFHKGPEKPVTVRFGEWSVPFGSNIIFADGSGSCPDPLMVSAEICEDLWVVSPPSERHAKAGANLIVNLSASNEVIGKASYRRSLITSASGRMVSGYVYSSAGAGESTQDLVFAGVNLIAENGSILSDSAMFEDETIFADIDIQKLMQERRRISTFQTDFPDDYRIVDFTLDQAETRLEKAPDRHPFIPEECGAINQEMLTERCDQILRAQSAGLIKRMKTVGTKYAVIGLSGGLDSTLALLVTVRAFDKMGIDRKNILAVTMPCFGTTKRTRSNAEVLSEVLGTDFRTVSIEKAVLQHFEDIGQSAENHDVTYENSQARERTQVLMDLANMVNGLVIGTGDLSELALGWATYNGDHMSMYGVNAGIPKTLVRYLVRYEADFCGNEKLKATLLDILDTPVSPELLPPKDGEISQQTEDLVGPYELHDFFLYYLLRFGFGPKKIYRLARLSFHGVYEDETILKWLKTFIRRFFSQQFKRSCLPDAPKVGSVDVSPRGSLRMPSDASREAWLKELD